MEEEKNNSPKSDSLEIDIEKMSEENKRKILNHKLKLQESKYDDTWKSFCLTMDRRAITYFTTIIAVFGVMIFSMIQLIKAEECNETETYIGLLTFLIGVILPHPKFDNDKK